MDLTKEQLIEDLIRLRQRISELEQLEEDKKRYEEELSRTKAMFEGLFEFAPDAIIVFDKEGGIVRANIQAERMLGYTREEWRDLSVESLLPERFRDLHTAHRLQYMSGPHVRPMGTALELFRKDGHEFSVDISLGPLKVEKDVFVLAVIRDVSERARLEACKRKEQEFSDETLKKLQYTLAELKRSNAELEQYAYVASHDLQEPLRKIASFAAMIEKKYKGSLDADADRYIGYIVDGAMRMRAMIDDLLTYSRAGARNINMTKCDCNYILKQVLDDMQQTISDSSAVVSHDALPAVTADATQLGQVFQNLVGNAIKFHRDETPRVHVSARHDGREWIFSVSDNGIGIEPGSLNRIFVMFQRLHKLEEYPGTGIGLALCKKIVERHGGRIWAESEPGKGSTFYFTIYEDGIPG